MNKIIEIISYPKSLFLELKGAWNFDEMQADIIASVTCKDAKAQATPNAINRLSQLKLEHCIDYYVGCSLNEFVKKASTACPLNQPQKNISIKEIIPQ